MCELCDKLDELAPSNTSKSSKRLWMWQFRDSVHCPLVGTCLSNQDLLNLTRKLKLQVSHDCQDYDLHAYFVTAAAKKSPEAKAMHKLLDSRYNGALRKFGKLSSDNEVLAVWNDMKESGNIAPAFYATMTLKIISQDVRSIIFGEVHMLSHLMGASYRKRTVEAAILKSRLDEALNQKARIQAGFQETLAIRDEQLKQLHSKLKKALAKEATLNSSSRTKNEKRSCGKRIRAVEVARAKARLAEKEAKVLRSEMSELKKELVKLRRQIDFSHQPKKMDETHVNLNGRSVLYVGGRPSQIADLEKTACKCGANFLHHDGGKEDSISRLDSVLPSIDCVLCPINCVSHDACLRVKSGCKKYGKTFIPLRNSSQAAMKQALVDLHVAIQ